MLETAASGSHQPRAYLRIGGMTVARQQLSLALALNCERIVCIAHAAAPELADLQQAAEGAGAFFNVISGPRQLIGLVTAIDEVIVIGDGLFVSTPDAAALLEQGPAVLVQPIEQGLAAGFERIDLNTAGAAAMRIPGRLVERIAELPADCDATSALQRIALQAGVRQRPIPAPIGTALFWTLVRSEEEAHALEPLWIRQRTREDAPLGPSRGIALLAVRGLGPALLHAGSGGKVMAIAAAVLAIFGLGAGWFGFPGIGLGLCGLGWITRETAAMLARIEGDGSAASGPISSRVAYGWLIDAVMITLATWAAGAVPPVLPLADRAFPPLVLIGLLRLLPRTLDGRWGAWFADRALVALFLSLTILAGVGAGAIYLACVLLLMLGILLPRAEQRLTRA